MPYRSQLKSYQPRTEQEKRDKANILHQIELEGDDILHRKSRLAHITSSGFIVNKALTKTLMVHHNIYNTWAWSGGHADGEQDLLQIAIKEAKEETGIRSVTPLSEAIMSIDILTVPGHYKHGEYVSTHLHLSAAYVLIGDENEALTIKYDENSGVKWIPLKDMDAMSNEAEIIPVYHKLVERARGILI